MHEISIVVTNKSISSSCLLILPPIHTHKHEKMNNIKEETIKVLSLGPMN
jgi:hypothetical protein